MAVTEGSLTIGVGSDAGAKLGTTTLTNIAGETVHREEVVTADPETLAARQKVTNAAPSSSDYGSVVRPIGPADLITKDGRASSSVVLGFTDTQSIHLDVATDSTLIAFMLIDLSNTAVWKHTNTGEIVLEYLIIEVDPDANFSGEVKIGFATDVDADNGDFHTILDIDQRRKTSVLVEIIEFGSHGFHCSTDSHFGPILANSTLLQTTGANLGGPDDPGTGTYPSGDGDLIMIIDGDGTNFVNVSVTIGYETVA